jgi:hypothetical protein
MRTRTTVVWVMAASAAGALATAGLSPARASGGSEEIVRAAQPSDIGDGVEPANAGAHEIPAPDSDDRELGPNASISFVGPFPGEEPPWPTELTRLAACLDDHGITEMPQNHDEVVDLWSRHDSGEHYVWRDGGVFFDYSDPAVAEAWNACR